MTDNKKNITIKLVHTGGPFGDCTSNYDVETNASTLGEFISAVLGRDNYETFCIHTGEFSFGKSVCLAYAKDGEIVRKASNYDSLISLGFKSAEVNGGWGNMGYDICVEGELPVQEKEEFEMVYWGWQ